MPDDFHSREDGQRSFAFDAARGLAALAVLVAHARSFVFRDAADQGPMSLSGQAFFALSGLGHQAVVVFFVVSGALVTRSLLSLERSRRLTVSAFWLPRLTRLWVVLIPCLLIGGLLDLWGVASTGPEAYGALRASVGVGPIHLDAGTLAGNMVFLQTIAVSPFGSNVPLWSLAHEAWYYAAAFLAMAVWGGRGSLSRALLPALALGAVLAGVFTPALWTLAPTWLAGAMIAPACGAARPMAFSRATRTLGLVLFVAAMVATRVTAARHQTLGDLGLAGATALVLALNCNGKVRAGLPSAVLRAMSRFSYTLYLSHFPLLALVAAIALHGRRLPLGLEGFAWMGTMIVLAIGWATALWWLFERHTGTVRRALEHWLGPVLSRPGRPERLAPDGVAS